jgi:hypothetical protein
MQRIVESGGALAAGPNVSSEVCVCTNGEAYVVSIELTKASKHRCWQATVTPSPSHIINEASVDVDDETA